MKRLALILPLLLSLLNLQAANRRLVVLRAEFRDVKFSTSQEHLDSLLQISKKWLDAQFAPKDSVTIDLGPVVTLEENQAWYGANSTSDHDALLYKAVMEACRQSDDKIDFSLYDFDTDGQVDNVYIIMAGESEAGDGSEDCIWPRYGSLKDYNATLTLDNRKIVGFCVCTEHDTPGTFCHEYMHSFGLPDFYDTDDEGSGGRSNSMFGCISIMDLGCGNGAGLTPPNLCAPELEFLGLGECLPLKKGTHTLGAGDGCRRFLKCPTANEGEFYLLECRNDSGWDEGIGGSGMLIYHVDRSESSAGWSDYYRRELTAAERWNLNEVNCRPDNPCSEIIPARPDARSASEAFFTGADASSFAPHASPLAISGIRTGGDGSVSFDVIEPVSVRECNSFQDAVILAWEVDSLIADGCRCGIIWSKEGADDSAEGVQGHGGSFSHTLEGLEPGTAYSIKICVTTKSRDTFSLTSEITTKSYRSGSRPYIYLAGAARGSDGSFSEGAKIPLRVYNAPDAASVAWTMDGVPVSTGDDGYYTIKRSGLLKAEVFWKSGGCDIIIKNIVVK